MNQNRAWSRMKMWIPVWMAACSSRPEAAPPAALSALSSLQSAYAAPSGLRTQIVVEGANEYTQVTGHDLALGELPFKDWIGLPVSGRGDVALDLRVPIDHGERDFRGARGSIVFHCTGCTVGDDLTKLPVKPRSNLPAELEFGHIAFDRVDIKVVLADGRAEITEWNVASPEVVLRASGRLDLAKQLDRSPLAACLRFAGTDDLRARDPKTYSRVSTTGALRSTDGMFHIKLEGPLGDIRRLGAPCDERVASATTATTVLAGAPVP